MNATDQLLNVLEDTAKLLQKTQINLKKCPKSRLTPGYLEVRLKCIEEYWKTFVGAHQDLVRCTPRETRSNMSYFVNEDYYLCEDLYLCLQADIKDTLKTVQPAHVQNMSIVPQDMPSCTQVKLPRIELPRFGGNYEDWPTFHDLFTSLVHNNTTLSKVQMMQYLKSSVSGEAEALLKHIQITENNYEQAWQTLNQRYGNKRLIVNSLLKRLFGLKKMVTQNSGQIKTLLDTTTECLNSLQNIKVSTESWDPMIIFLVVSKLDFESHKDWEECAYTTDSNELPTWQGLRDFLESKFRTLELVTPNMGREKPSRERTFHLSTLAQSRSCSMCNSSHHLCRCEAFGKLSVTDRAQFVKQNNLCYNCLTTGHPAHKCRVTASCHVCQRRHHTLLHQSNTVQQGEVQVLHSGVETSEEDANLVQEEEVPITSLFASKSSTALLATAIVPIRDEFGQVAFLRALIDPGSQANFISERAVQLLRVQKQPARGTVTGIGSTETLVKHVVNLKILSRHESDFELSVKAYVMPSRLTSQLPSKSISRHTWPHIQGLALADPSFYIPDRIDLLLGVEVCAKIWKGEVVEGPAGSPCAQSTRLGWILFGEIQEDTAEEKIMVLHQTLDLDDMLKRMWELDTDTNITLTKEEKNCEKIYEENYERNSEGRYIVKLPFKNKEPKILEGRTRDLAMKNLLQLEKRLKRNPELKKEYVRVMDDYLEMNHMEEVPSPEIDNKAVYLPHHPVIRDDKETTKVRIVFNASARGINNASLNEELLVGPQLQEDIRYLVMRWRLWPVCFVADIQKMYRQILVKPADADYQRILWRRDDTEPVKDYRLLRVTFGTAAAPYLAVKTLHKLAEEASEEHPDAGKIIKEDFFMDDILSGKDTAHEAIHTAKTIAAILGQGGFVLQKWASNNLEFLQAFGASERSTQVMIDLRLSGTIKTLGITWDIGEDIFRYKLALQQAPKIITKRNILAEIQRLFDPLGWLAPALLPAKLLIQTLWLKGVSWDTEVDDELKETWYNIRDSFKHLSDIKITRWLQTTQKTIDDATIHGFCDASNKAYGAVAYLRVRGSDGNYKTSLIAAKTRVAPIKPVSLPRLELCGAVLLSQLLKQISQATRIPARRIYAWTDSTIVLAWLQGDPSRWQTFVRNRVVTILDNIGNQWYHVKSQENPADVASRGLLVPDLKECELWWKGPGWLQNENIDLHKPDITTTDLEIIKKLNVNAKIEQDRWATNFDNFNSLSELKKTIVYCIRFLNSKRHPHLIQTEITTQELENALLKCIRVEQQEEFSEEIRQIKKKKDLKKTSKLLSLNPYLDEENILRVGGRLKNSTLPLDEKHPIILAPNGELSKLIVSDAHKKTLHGGVQLMLCYLRSKYWLIRAKNVVKTCIHKCLVCARQKVITRQQMMGELPSVRITEARPFLHSGVDFAGPLQVLASRGRGIRTNKAYIAIFICMATKAIHLELVGDLSTDSFIGAFHRFIARRGRCTHIWSDQGRNFIGANRELAAALEDAKLELPGPLVETLALEGTQWHFIPPYSPNFGGLWEAGVKSVKHHLRRILSSHLSFEELSTVLCDIEACLNSRPLVPIDPTDTDMLVPLTPGSFLIGEAPVTVPCPDLREVNINRLSRWQLTQKLTREFWHRWQTEYLSRLQQRPKWLKTQTEFNIGDIVLLKDDHLPPCKWSLGRIVDKHPGPDGLTRVYSVRTRNEIVKRSVMKLCYLPVDVN